MDKWVGAAQPSAVRFLKRKSYTYHFPCTIGENDKNGVAVCSMFIECEAEGKLQQMSCKLMNKEESLKRMKEENEYYFLPLVGFWIQEEKVLCIGHFIGDQFDNWLASQTIDSLWQVDGFGKIVIAGPELSQLIREVAEALTIYHQQHKKPLGFSCDNLYIQGSSFKLCDSYAQDNVRGIKKDLREFTKFVNRVAGNHVTDRNMKLFNALSQNYLPSDIDELLIRSYFICHSPITWSKMERSQFTNAYDSMLKSYNQDFLKAFKMNYDIYRVDNWVSRIPPSPHPLREVYNYRWIGKTWNHSHLLVLYIRYCHHHYYEEINSSPFSNLDEQLLSLFPNAFPATYGELADKFNSFPPEVPRSELLTLLKYAGLLYTKGSSRERAAIREQRMY